MISTVITLWLGVGSLFVPHRDSRLPVSVAGCLDIVNGTALTNSIRFTTLASIPDASPTAQDILSFKNYTSSSDIAQYVKTKANIQIFGHLVKFQGGLDLISDLCVVFR